MNDESQCNTDLIDWVERSFSTKLPESIIEMYVDLFNWDHLSLNHRWSDSFYDRMSSHFNWSLVTTLHENDEPFLERFRDRVDWSVVFPFDKSLEFLERVKTLLPSGIFSEVNSLSDWMLIRYKDTITWPIVCRSAPLEIRVIDTLRMELDWDGISESRLYDESFFENFHEWVNWEIISGHSHSFGFLSRNSDTIDWELQSMVIPLIPQFLVNFRESIHWDVVFNRPDFTPERCDSLKVWKDLKPFLEPVDISESAKAKIRLATFTEIEFQVTTGENGELYDANVLQKQIS